MDPYKNILVGAGAYEALFCGIMSTVNGGDEVSIEKNSFSIIEVDYKKDQRVESVNQWYELGRGNCPFLLMPPGLNKCLL